MTLGEKLERHFMVASSKGSAAKFAPQGQEVRQQTYENTIPSSNVTNVREATRPYLSFTTQEKGSTPQERRGTALCLDLFPINGQALPNENFRKALSKARQESEKAVRRVISEQLLRCQTPQEILRSVTIAMQRPETAKQLANSHQAITRSIYRSRNNATDERALATITIVVLSLRKANLPVHHELLNLGAKFSARARSLGGMKRYLRELKINKTGMTKSNFRAIIAKFSIGKRGLGEIRNRRWLRRDLLQVLLGFDDPDTERPYHLETFMDRQNWLYLHAWITVLSRCKAVDQLHKEWDLWLDNPSRTISKQLITTGKNVSSRVRGDYWFIEQMCYAGDIAKAWQILCFTEIPFNDLRPAVQSMLLSEPQHATFWNADIQKAMMRKYEEEMCSIEAAIGATWVNTGPDGQGHHLVPENLDNEAMEKLSDPEFLSMTPPGFPWESDPLVLQAQKELNEAEEVDVSAQR